MSKLLFVVMTNPVEGREDEFNEWYSAEHLEDVVAVEGMRAAQRFELVPSQLGENVTPPFRYLAIYEAEDADEGAVERVEQALLAAAGTDAMPISRAMDRPQATWWFRAITDRVVADGGE
jgi:hypothetical protein